MKHEDKWNHFAGCYAAHNILAHTMLAFGLDIVVSVVLASVATVLGGFLVELYQDKMGIDTTDGWDMLANIIGIAASVCVLAV